MPFGNLITDGAEQAVGSVGYLVAFDLKSARVQRISQTILQRNGSLETVSTASTLAQLVSYCDSVNAPNFAWYQQGTALIIFCKTAIYPFDGTTRMGVFFWRNTIPIYATTDKVDCPDRAHSWLLSLIDLLVAREDGDRVELAVAQKELRERIAMGVE